MDIHGVMNRLLSVGTLLVACGSIICFASASISSALESRIGEPPAFLKSIGWDNAVKLAGLAVAVIGALILFSPDSIGNIKQSEEETQL